MITNITLRKISSINVEKLYNIIEDLGYVQSKDFNLSVDYNITKLLYIYSLELLSKKILKDQRVKDLLVEYLL